MQVEAFGVGIIMLLIALGDFGLCSEDYLLDVSVMLSLAILFPYFEVSGEY